MVERFLKKGSKVFIEGSLSTRKWQDKDGQDRYSTEVVLRGLNGTLTMLDGAQGGGGGGQRSGGWQQGGSQESGGGDNWRSGGSGGSGAPSGGGSGSGGGSNYDDLDDDIPF